MILMHLQDYGSITSIQAMQEYGIMRLASRINDLKREGYNIVSETMKSHNRFGETVHYSVYRLKEEKEN
jgi:hypothetical protein